MKVSKCDVNSALTHKNQVLITPINVSGFIKGSSLNIMRENNYL